MHGRGQLTQAGLIEFIAFMLQTSLDQIHDMIEALERTTMRERLERLVMLEPPILEAGIEAGIKPQAARATHSHQPGVRFAQ